MRAEGVPDAEIDRQIAAGRAEDARVYGPPADYAAYLAATTTTAPMSAERFAFAARNFSADSTSELKAMTAPVLAMWGADDLNVDARRELQVYGDALTGQGQEVVLWPDATHGLTRVDLGNHQLASQWSSLQLLRAIGAGRRIFAPGAVEFIGEWITEHS